MLPAFARPLVAACLQEDPERRPPVASLLECDFFGPFVRTAYAFLSSLQSPPQPCESALEGPREDILEAVIGAQIYLRLAGSGLQRFMAILTLSNCLAMSSWLFI